MSKSQVIANLKVRIYIPSELLHPIPIVLLHGMWAADWCFQLWVSWLVARGYKVILINLPGHGGSIPSKPLGEYSIADFVEAVWSALIALNEKKVHFVGHSMGGLILQKILEKQAVELECPIVAKAVLLMSAPPAGIRLRGQILRTLLKPRYSIPILRSLEFKPTKDDAFALVLNQGLEGHRSEIYDQFVPESGRAARDIIFWRVSVSGKTVKKSLVPILVVSGQFDLLIPTAVQFKTFLKYQTPDTSFKMLPTGHMPMYGKHCHDNIKKITTWLHS